jgi:hypothetical protein
LSFFCPSLRERTGGWDGDIVKEVLSLASESKACTVIRLFARFVPKGPIAGKSISITLLPADRNCWSEVQEYKVQPPIERKERR